MRVPLEWVAAPAILAALLLAWQLGIGWSGISRFVMPGPGAVWAALLGLLATPATWRHLWATASETLAGFGAGAGAGIAAGLLVGRVRWLERTLAPFVVASQLVPKVALVPLFVIWFGFGAEPKVLTAAVMSAFPVFTATVHGVTSIEAGHRDVMASLDATPLQRLIHLDLRAALPAVLSGMEVGIVLALSGCVVAQLLGGNSGLGFLLVATMNAYATDRLFAVIVLLAALGLVFHLLLRLLRWRLVPWHGGDR